MFFIPITWAFSALALLKDLIWMIFDQRNWSLYNKKSDYTAEFLPYEVPQEATLHQMTG